MLDYLVSILEDRNENVYYLFDNRCKDDYLRIPENRKEYVVPTIKFRYEFYSKNRNTFSKVLCFGNLPPMRHINCVVYTYFHQRMYLNIPEEFSVKDRVMFSLKQIFLGLTKQNTDYWLVQNKSIKSGLSKKYKIKEENILVRAFYPNADLYAFSNYRKKNRFIYVSSGAPHKNHIRLINAFCDFYDNNKEGELVLTVGKEFFDVIAVINDKVKQHYPIINIGFVGREELVQNYHKAEYLIFPSLEESFGLGIVEAIECGCKVIGADLPYLYQVCNPSIVFDPLDIKSIRKAFFKGIKKEEKVTEQKVFNGINQLIDLLKN